MTDTRYLSGYFLNLLQSILENNTVHFLRSRISGIEQAPAKYRYAATVCLYLEASNFLILKSVNVQFKEVNYKQKSVMSVQYSNFSCLLVLGVVSMMCVILGVASPVTGPESVQAGDDVAVPAVDKAAVPAVAGAPVVDAGRAATVAACRRCLASHYSLLCVFSMFVDFLVHNARLS